MIDCQHPTLGRIRVSPFELLESYKASWGEWRCEVEMPDGEIRLGTVQTDGHMMAEETLELDSDE